VVQTSTGTLVLRADTPITNRNSTKVTSYFCEKSIGRIFTALCDVEVTLRRRRRILSRFFRAHLLEGKYVEPVQCR